MPRVRRALRVLVAVWLAAGASVFCAPGAFAEPLILQITAAQAAFDQRTNAPIVTFRFADASKQAFAAFTTRHVGRAVELRVDGKTVLKAIVREPILGGSGQIPTSSVDEARALATRLSAGTAKVEVEAAADQPSGR